MSDDSSVSSNNLEKQPSRKFVNEDFWSRMKKLESPFGRDTSYLRAEA